MRTKLISLLLLSCLAGCAAQMPYPTLPADVKTLTIDGASFAAPAEGPWGVKTHTPFALEIGRQGKDQDESIVVDAFDFHPPPVEPGKDFVATVKESEEKDTTAPRFVMKLHEVVPVTIGSATCARSHMLAEDHAPQLQGGVTGKMMLLEILSLNCLHPDHPDKAAFNIGYSQRFYPGDQDPDFMRKATAILDSVQITKLY